MFDINTLKFNSDGLIPVVTQDAASGAVLMQAYMTKEAVEKTLETGKATYYSRSRNCLWVKGETSGNTQRVIKLSADCDLDSLLMTVEQKGVACHTGSYSCFFNDVKEFDKVNSVLSMRALESIVYDRKANPVEGSYTNYLFNKGVDKICKKVGEEATESVIAAKNNSKEEMAYEISDLIYHLTVLMANANMSWADIYKELDDRHLNPPKEKK